jgi:RNA polymerase sigma-70 factor (ECF subfamily)
MGEPLDRLYERLLIVRCQTGDAGAFEELVGRFSPRLRLFLRKLLAGDATTEDVLQESWLDVWRKIGSLEKPDAFPAWVYRIARDHAYRRLRRQPREESSDLGNVEDNGVEFSPDEAEELYRAMDRLSPEHREVIVLRFLEEMSYDDIARIADCSVGTVRSRLHYAKRTLRRLLEGEPNGNGKGTG